MFSCFFTFGHEKKSFQDKIPIIIHQNPHFWWIILGSSSLFSATSTSKSLVFMTKKARFAIFGFSPNLERTVLRDYWADSDVRTCYGYLLDLYFMKTYFFEKILFLHRFFFMSKCDFFENHVFFLEKSRFSMIFSKNPWFSKSTFRHKTFSMKKKYYFSQTYFFI